MEGAGFGRIPLNYYALLQALGGQRLASGATASRFVLQMGLQFVFYATVWSTGAITGQSGAELARWVESTSW
jgi:hypothetical protein